jgi:hypothetical protein
LLLIALIVFVMDFVFGVHNIEQCQRFWKGMLGFIYKFIGSDQMATTATGTKKWYVLRAISGKEKKVKEVIDAEVCGAPTWAPTSARC